jgi:mannose-6-phosphate isomerase-like protein (cupin superfamily)
VLSILNTNAKYNRLNGAVVTRVLEHPQHAFAFEVTFFNKHPQLLAAASRKAPLHFHPYQEEYVEVLEGALCIQIEGDERTLLPEDGTICVRPWTNHRIYPPQNCEFESTKFLLWANQTTKTFKLDLVFFTNWYGIQDEVVLQGKGINLLQVMSTFDAGSSYLSLPRWIPFGQYIARALGVVLGRWLGGIMGIQPYHRKWTMDWNTACEKMEKSFFQRRFARRSKGD